MKFIDNTGGLLKRNWVFFVKAIRRPGQYPSPVWKSEILPSSCEGLLIFKGLNLSIVIIVYYSVVTVLLATGLDKKLHLIIKIFDYLISCLKC